MFLGLLSPSVLPDKSTTAGRLLLLVVSDSYAGGLVLDGGGPIGSENLGIGAGGPGPMGSENFGTGGIRIASLRTMGGLDPALLEICILFAVAPRLCGSSEELGLILNGGR